MSRKRKLILIPSITILGILLIYLILLFTNYCFNLGLRKYIKSFNQIEYSNQLIPTIENEGYYTFRTDDDLKIMQLTDLHIGGGLFSFRRDKKTLYEVATMVSIEKPDLIILTGDNVFAVPGPIFNGGGTLDNKMVSKTVLTFFDQLGVYYSTVFGNHDTESFNYTSREKLGKLYEDPKYKYCIYESNFDGYGVTNQCILHKTLDGEIVKAIVLLDSNAYLSNSISATINWQYDTIRDEQVLWAKSVIEELSPDKNNCIKSLFFFHIPIGEFEEAYRELESNDFDDTENTKFISGFWDEKIDDEMGGRIWYGGCSSNKDPKDNDILFEELGPDGMNSMEACFVGHDHVNTAAVVYKNVMLSYGYSLDNSAYTGIRHFGKQRGSTVIIISKDGTFNVEHKNAYTDYDVSLDKYFDVSLDEQIYDGACEPSNN